MHDGVLGRLVFAQVLMVLGATAAGAVSDPIQFAPHRAIYDVTLEQSSPGSGIADLTGRMVYELTGNACEGYAQKFRYVTITTDQDGGSNTGDLRSSSWEDAAGTRLRFDSTQYQNHTLSDTTQGSAKRAAEAEPVAVDVAKPQKKKLALSRSVVFPMQHSAALIRAALAGKTIFAADLYDGSEKGEKVSPTTAVIGRQLKPGTVTAVNSLPNGAKLAQVPSWPVSIGFFEPNSERRDAVPTAEQSYRFYANGVSSELISNFGDYTLRFDLTDLTFLDAGACKPAQQ